MVKERFNLKVNYSYLLQKIICLIYHHHLDLTRMMAQKLKNFSLFLISFFSIIP